MFVSKNILHGKQICSFPLTWSMTLIGSIHSLNKCLLNTSMCQDLPCLGCSCEQDRQGSCPHGTYKQESGVGPRVWSTAAMEEIEQVRGTDPGRNLLPSGLDFQGNLSAKWHGVEIRMMTCQDLEGLPSRVRDRKYRWPEGITWCQHPSGQRNLRWET